MFVSVSYSVCFSLCLPLSIGVCVTVSVSVFLFLCAFVLIVLELIILRHYRKCKTYYIKRNDTKQDTIVTMQSLKHSSINLNLYLGLRLYVRKKTEILT